ncbi:MAG TPA: hypothetical protein VF211_11425 [Burkholderiales bacterium]
MQKLKVRFTEQQLVLLNKLLAEGTFGKTLEEVCLNVYREYTRVLFGMERE